MTAFTGTIPTIASGDTTTVPTNLATYRDCLKAESEAMTAYTPTLTGFSLGTGTIVARYSQVGKKIWFRIYFAAGGSSSYTATPHAISLPVTAHASGEQSVNVKLYTGALNFVGNGSIAASGTTVAIQVPTTTTTVALTQQSNTTPNPGTAGNLIIEGFYESA